MATGTCRNGHVLTEANTRMYRGHRYCRECQRAREAKALEAKVAYNRGRRAANRVAHNAYKRAYYAANRERLRADDARRYSRNPKPKKEASLRRGLRMRVEHPDELRAYRITYRASHRAEHRASKLRRRARLLGAAGSFSAAEWNALLARYDYACGYCGRADVSLEADHRTPLARGGTGYIDNIIPSCHRCNCRKGTKTEAEFRAAMEPLRP